MKRCFKQQIISLNYDTFWSWITVVEKIQKMKENVHIETIIAMALARLGNGNSLQMCGKVYNIAKNTTIIT
jgi:hypothetical protein